MYSPHYAHSANFIGGTTYPFHHFPKFVRIWGSGEMLKREEDIATRGRDFLLKSGFGYRTAESFL